MDYWPDYSGSSLPNTAHPNKADRFGRVWVGHHGDTYIHDGAISCPENLVMSPSMQLPNRKLRGNPNYAGLCEICKSEW